MATVSQNLSINNLVTVSINLSPAAAQAQNLSAMLVLGNSPVIDPVVRMETFTSETDVAAAFGTSAPEYLAAELWFSQQPQPSTISIGRWVQTASIGQLFCGVLTPTYTLPATWAAITAGNFQVAIDGVGPSAIGPINFAGVTTMAGVAAKIDTALNAVFSGATCTYDPIYNRFVLDGVLTGPSGDVSFLTAGGVTDISGFMEGLASDAVNGAYTVAGLAAESAVTAAALFDSQFGQQWYALDMPTITADSDHLAVAAYINATSTNKHVYGYTTQESGVLVPNNNSNLPYQMKQLNYNRSIGQYSSSSIYAIASLLGRILTVDYTANNSAITVAYKGEPGVQAETLSQPQYAALLSYNCNAFMAFNDGTANIQPGVVASGLYFDAITGTDNFAVTLQNAVYNALYTSPTKIPQTDTGVHTLLTVIDSVCSQFVQDGVIAPGTWTVGGFGSLAQGQFLPTGFYTFATPIAQQQQAQRAARISPPIQIAIKLAGAIQYVNIAVLVNQ
jgi:hypothetical protein